MGKLVQLKFYHKHIKEKVPTHFSKCVFLGYSNVAMYERTIYHPELETNHYLLRSQQQERKFSRDSKRRQQTSWSCCMKIQNAILTRSRHTLAHARRNSAFYIIYRLIWEQREVCHRRSLITVCVSVCVCDFITFSVQDKDPICLLVFFFLLQQITDHKRSCAVSGRGKKKNSPEFLFYCWAVGYKRNCLVNTTS